MENRREAPIAAVADYASGVPRKSRAGVIVGAVAAALAAAAVYNTYNARRAERRHPARGRFVDVDGIRLHYLEKGEGPPVVLVHGNVLSSEDFAYSGVLDLAAERHRVVAFDRPGMGYSDRPTGTIWTPAAQAGLLRRAFDRLGLERPVVVGHSWGAMVAIALGLDHPEAVRGLVLLSGYYYPTVRADFALAAPSAVPVVGDVLRYTVSPLVGAAVMQTLVKGLFAPRPVPEHFSETFPLDLSVRPSQIRASAQDGTLMSAAAAAMSPRYRELKMPVVIMTGTEDKVADVTRHSARLHEEIPHSVLRLVPNVGHMVHHAVPEEVVSAIDTVSSPTEGVRDRRLAGALP